MLCGLLRLALTLIGKPFSRLMEALGRNIVSFQFRLKKGSLTLLIKLPDFESFVIFLVFKWLCLPEVSDPARFYDFTLFKLR